MTRSPKSKRRWRSAAETGDLQPLQPHRSPTLAAREGLQAVSERVTDHRVRLGALGRGQCRQRPPARRRPGSSPPRRAPPGRWRARSGRGCGAAATPVASRTALSQSKRSTPRSGRHRPDHVDPQGGPLQGQAGGGGQHLGADPVDRGGDAADAVQAALHDAGVPAIGRRSAGAADLTPAADLHHHRAPGPALVEGERLRAARVDEPGAGVDPAGVVMAAEGQGIAALPDLGGGEGTVDALAGRAAAGLGAVEEGEVDAVPGGDGAAVLRSQPALQGVAGPGRLLVAEPQTVRPSASSKGSSREPRKTWTLAGQRARR